MAIPNIEATYHSLDAESVWAVLLLLFRAIIGRKIFPKRSPSDAYRLPRLMVISCLDLGNRRLGVMRNGAAGWRQPLPRGASRPMGALLPAVTSVCRDSGSRVGLQVGESRCEDHTLSAPDGSQFVAVTRPRLRSDLRVCVPGLH